MKKKKDFFDPMGLIIDNTRLSVGVMLGVGLVGKTGESLPSPVSSKIIGGMEPLSMVPMFHAAGGLFSSLDYLGKDFKKKKR